MQFIAQKGQVSRVAASISGDSSKILWYTRQKPNWVKSIEFPGEFGRITEVNMYYGDITIQTDKEDGYYVLTYTDSFNESNVTLHGKFNRKVHMCQVRQLQLSSHVSISNLFHMMDKLGSEEEYSVNHEDAEKFREFIKA